MGSVLTIDSIARDPVADQFLWGRLLAHTASGVPELVIRRRGARLASLPDPWLQKTASLTIDTGSGPVTRFAGDVYTVDWRYDGGPRGAGWCLEYVALGLKQRLNLMPLVDDNTTTDTSRYNLPGDDPDFLGSRAGRTVGQILISVLEGATNSGAMIAAGVGAFTSSGTGAAAHCTLTSGVVDTTIVVDSGGSGWTTAPTVIFIGGNPTAPATATATVSGGVVTAITRTSGGSGYQSIPTILLSRLPATTLADLTTGPPSTLIPPYEAQVEGERLGQALESFLRRFSPNYSLHVDHATAALRFLDPRGFTNRTITLNAVGSRWDMPSLRRSTAENFSRVVVKGQPITEPCLVAVAKGTLAEDFGHDGLSNSAAKTNWKLSDYQNPGQPNGQATGNASISGGHVSSIAVQYGGYGYTAAPAVTITGGGGTGAAFTSTITSGAVTSFTQTAAGTGYTSVPNITVAPPGNTTGNTDSGSCTCPNTTTVRITSSNAGVAWAANYWDQTSSGKTGVLFLTYSAGAGLTQTISRRVTANTSLAAGGTSDLTVDIALPNTLFDAYTLVGTMAGGSPVWRRYKVVDPVVARALARRFAYPVPFKNSAGNAVALTSAPTSSILYSITGTAPFGEKFLGFTLDPDSGSIVFDQPVVLLNGSTANLTIGGAATDGIPSDVQVFLAVNKGSNHAVYPPDDAYGNPTYAGTLYSVEGIGRTLTVQVPQWRDPSNQANMALLAQEIHGTCSDSFVEGQLTYFGLYEEALDIGNKYAIAGNGFNTPFSSENYPCVSCTLEWITGPEGSLYKTHVEVSNRRRFASAAGYLRPAISAGSIMLDVAGPTALGSGSSIGGDFYGMTKMGAAGAAMGELQGTAGSAASQFTSAAGSALGGFTGASGAAFEAMQGVAGASADQFHDGVNRGSDAQLADPHDAGFARYDEAGSGDRTTGMGAQTKRLAAAGKRAQGQVASGDGQQRAAAALASYYQSFGAGEGTE